MNKPQFTAKHTREPDFVLGDPATSSRFTGRRRRISQESIQTLPDIWNNTYGSSQSTEQSEHRPGTSTAISDEHFSVHDSYGFGNNNRNIPSANNNLQRVQNNSLASSQSSIEKSSGGKTAAALAASSLITSGTSIARTESKQLPKVSGGIANTQSINDIPTPAPLVNEQAEKEKSTTELGDVISGAAQTALAVGTLL